MSAALSSDRLIGLLLPLMFLVAFLGIPLMLLRERRRPTSYTRSPGYLAGREQDVADPAVWRVLPTRVQAAVDADAIADGVVADGFDAAVLARAEESARLAVQRAADINAQFHP